MKRREAFTTALERFHHLALALIGGLSLALYVFLSGQNPGGNAVVEEILGRFFAVVAALFMLLLAAAYVMRRAARRPARASLIIIVLGAALFRGVLLPQQPWLSNDIHRYLWDAQLVERGINPYSFPPEAEELTHLREAANFPQMGHKNVHSVYPPLLQFLFWSGLKTGHALGLPAYVGIKLIFALIDIGLVLFLMRWLPQLRLDPRWAVLYAWHPLPIIEIAGAGHTDGMGACVLVLMIAFLMQRRYLPATVCLALGFLIKFITVLFLPFLLLAAWKEKEAGFKKAGLIAAVFVLIVAASYAPFAEAGKNLYSGLLLYSEKWRFNDGFFSLLFTFIHALLPDGLVKALMVPPHWEVTEIVLATRRVDLALVIAKLIIGVLFVFIYVRFWLHSLKDEAFRLAPGYWTAMAIIILTAFFLLSPTLQPWYLIWILPLLCLDGLLKNFSLCQAREGGHPGNQTKPWIPAFAGMTKPSQFGNFEPPVQKAMPSFECATSMIIPLWLLSATVFVSYWVLADYLTQGIWRESWWVKWLEYGLPLGSWLWLRRLPARIAVQKQKEP